jgi:hypothetical protein
MEYVRDISNWKFYSKSKLSHIHTSLINQIINDKKELLDWVCSKTKYIKKRHCNRYSMLMYNGQDIGQDLSRDDSWEIIDPVTIINNIMKNIITCLDIWNDPIKIYHPDKYYLEDFITLLNIPVVRKSVVRKSLKHNYITFIYPIWERKKWLWLIWYHQKQNNKNNQNINNNNNYNNNNNNNNNNKVTNISDIPKDVIKLINRYI